MTSMAQALSVVERLSRLLRDEIAAITSGRLGEVTEIYPQKTALLAEVEEAFATPQALLVDHPQAAELRTKLAELRELIAQDHALLEKMTDATGAIIDELDRIRDRHSLSGTYGPDGEKRPRDVSSSQHFDQSL
ncbi:flagellar P-ring protein precursor [Pseudooceanicola batsensis HTCC2597]|uniref:Flagellar P-ring protein n=1 Tax=Pseudooceanicola batsensis (strain ATCC BAA-863 / DSM 15984 / KCTC 12145 / HTCC2597) TaxID=252305 RepID=A3U0Z6_PSEBH|nr:flagellar P-ring protein precursor [Pseudooceanicola batsensis]EAQ01979.1 flagellar P-ring protein precursor [Pseudooceanicola batsensis HTCC2597]